MICLSGEVLPENVNVGSLSTRLLIVADALKFMQALDVVQSLGDVKNFLQKNGDAKPDIIKVLTSEGDVKKWERHLASLTANSEDADATKAAVQSWHSEAMAAITGHVLGQMEQLKQDAKKWCETQLQENITKMHVWSRGQENTSWKARLAADANWDCVLAASKPLLASATASSLMNSYKHFSKDASAQGKYLQTTDSSLDLPELLERCDTFSQTRCPQKTQTLCVVQ